MTINQSINQPGYFDYFTWISFKLCFKSLSSKHPDFTNITGVHQQKNMNNRCSLTEDREDNFEKKSVV